MATMRAHIIEEMNKPTTPPSTPPPFLPSFDPETTERTPGPIDDMREQIREEMDGTLPPQPDNHMISVKVRGNTGGKDPHSVPITNGLENLVIDLSQVRHIVQLTSDMFSSFLTSTPRLNRVYRMPSMSTIEYVLKKLSNSLGELYLLINTFICFQSTTQRPSITFSPLSPEDEFGTSINSLFAMTTPTPMVTTTVAPTRAEMFQLISGTTELAQISDLSNIPGQMQGSADQM